MKLSSSGGLKREGTNILRHPKQDGSHVHVYQSTHAHNGFSESKTVDNKQII